MSEQLPQRFHRRIIRITADDSPNVRLARANVEAGLPWDHGSMAVPGVLPWPDYVKRRAMWDQIRQCIGLDARFWEGADVLMFPTTWLNRAEELSRRWGPPGHGLLSKAEAIGCDPAEGGDKTSMCAVNRCGVVELVSKKTPDTSVIRRELAAFMLRHGVPAARVCIDRGGGGKQIADEMKELGPAWAVRTVGFGERLVLDPKRGLRPLEERLDAKAEGYAFVTRRAEMYGTLRWLLDPSRDPCDGSGSGAGGQEPRTIGSASGKVALGFAIDSRYDVLRSELAPIPLTYDPEGRLYVIPKNHPRDSDSKRQTLVQLIGHSPDEADSLVLAVHAMLNESNRPTAGAMR